MTTIRYFKADWCGPCARTTPLAKEADVEIHDVDEEQDLANEYNIRSIPTLVEEDEDGIIEQSVGVQDVINKLEAIA